MSKHNIVYAIVIFFLSFGTAISNDSFILSSLEEAKQLSLETKQPLLLIFGADYCGACKDLKKDLVQDFKNDLTGYIVCYIDLSESNIDKNKNDITIIPDSRIFINSKMKSRMRGYSKAQYRKWIINVK